MFLTVTITGPEYRGVLLEARMDGSDNALGSWQHPPPDTRFLTVSGYHCIGFYCMNIKWALNVSVPGPMDVWLWLTVHRESTRCYDSFQHQHEGQHHRVQLDATQLHEPSLLQVKKNACFDISFFSNDKKINSLKVFTSNSIQTYFSSLLCVI